MANKVAFLHLPKLGGMSVESALVDALQPATLCQGFDRVLFGDFGEFGSLSIEERARIYNDLGALQRDVELVSGHFARSTLKSVYSSHSLFTIVRNSPEPSFTPSTTQEMADSVWLRTLCRYIESGVTSRLSAT